MSDNTDVVVMMDVMVTVYVYRQFCTGEHRRDGVPIGYKSCIFHRYCKAGVLCSDTAQMSHFPVLCALVHRCVSLLFGRGIIQ